MFWTMAGGAPTTFITGTGVGRHTEDRVPLVIARREGMNTAYLWCISFGAGAEQVALQSEEIRLQDADGLKPSGAAAARIKTASQNYILLVNPGRAAVAIGQQQVDGKIALLTQMADQNFRVTHSVK